MKLRHIGIVVNDLKEGVKWYERFNYYPFIWESVLINGGSVEICKMYHKDGSCIELIDGSTGVNHMSITCNQLEFEYLKENNDANMFEKEGVAYIRDPWGNVIEIVMDRGF